MLISLKDILGKKVETKSGQSLGRVCDVYINIDVHEIEQFEVEPDIIQRLMGKKLLIHRKQVIEIRKDKMIVEDGTVKQGRLVPAMDLDV